MSKYTAKKRIWTGIGALAALVLLVCALMMIGGVSAALDIKEGDTVQITYSVGTLPAGTAGVSVTSDAQSVTVNSSECIVLPDLRPTVSGGLDAETFTVDGKSYSFTGWQIVHNDVTEKIPGETVFQPGDAITFDVLEAFLGGSDGNYTLTLKALWGQCYFIRNPYTTMVYNYTNNSGFPVDTANSTGETGASDSYTGLIAAEPLASVDAVFEKIRAANNNQDHSDAYAYVVMLTGDLDYVKETNVSSKYFGYSGGTTDPASPVFTSATFKSLGNTAFNFNFKPNNTGATGTSVIFGNIRYDNVNFLHFENTHPNWQYKVNESNYDTTAETQFGEVIGYAYSLDAVTENPYYCDFTARMNQSVPKYRTHAIRTLRLVTTDHAVVNGGLYTEISARHSDNEAEEHNQVWRFGRNIYVNGIVYGGSVNSVSRIGTFDIYVTGGTIINLYSGGYGGTVTGSRNVYILGQKDVTTSFETPNSYVLTSGALVEDVFTDTETTYGYDPAVPYFEDVYGGPSGKTTFTGDINIVMRNAIYARQFYGAGDGNGTVNGDVSIEFYNTRYRYPTIDNNNNVWGAGNNTVQKNVTMTIDGPRTNLRDVYVGARSYGGVDGNVTVTINGGTLRQYYGGNMTAGRVIGGNSTTTMNGGKVTGVFFGGGSSGTTSGAILVTINGGTLDDTLYAALRYSAYAGTPKLVLNGGTLKNVYGGGTYNGQYQDGDKANKKIVTYSASVQGTDITVNGATITGTLYGGGYDAPVSGNTSIKVLSGSVANLCGGGQRKTTATLASQTGDVVATYDATVNATSVTVSGGTVGALYGGGRNASVTNDTLITVSGGKVTGSTYGGGYGGTVGGNTSVTIDGATVNRVYGGGCGLIDKTNYDATVGGSATVTVTNGSTAERIYGGGNYASVTGSAQVTINGGSKTSNVYGGCHQSGYTVGTAITVDISENSTVGNVYGGGDSGSFNGIPDLNISNSTVGVVYGGCYAGTVNGTDVSVENSTVNGVYGGGSTASATVNGNTNVSILNTNVLLSSSNNGAVFGGGHDGSVTGSVNLTLNNTTGETVKIDEELRGGCYSGSVGGDITLNVTNYTIDVRLFGGCFSGNVGGDILVNVNGGSVGTDICGGNHTGGSITGNVTLNLNGVQSAAVYGGSHSGGTIGGKITVNGYDGTSVTSQLFGGSRAVDYAGIPDVNIYGGSYNAVYGGGYSGSVAATDVQIYGGFVGTLYAGGGPGGGAVTGDTNLKMDALDPQATDMSVLNIRGGGSGQGADVGGNTNIFIRDVSNGDKKISIGHYTGESTVQEGSRNVLFGGGRYGAVAGTANITLLDCVIGDGSKPVSVYGGGFYPSATVGNVIWSLTNVTIKDTDVADDLASRFYGGGYFADVTENVTTTVAGQCDFDAHYYGGGFYGKVGDTVTNTIGGSSIFHRDLYGGGRIKGSHTHSDDVYKNQTFEYDAKVPLATTVIDGADIKVYGEVYGAGMQSTTEEAVLNIRSGRYGDFSANDTNDGNIYGGAYSGATGSSTVLIDGSAAVETERSVYGGGRMEGATNVSTVVTLNNPNAIINHYLFGGGIEGDVTQTTEVNIHAGKVDASVYGGCSTAMVGTENNANTAVTVNITGGDLKSVFGGGKGHADDENDSPVDAIVHGNIVLNILEGTDAYALDAFENIYGGGHSAKATVNGNITSTLDGITFKYFYGGGSNGIVNGNITNNATNFNLRDVYNAEGKITIGGDITFYGGGYRGAVNGNIVNNLTGTIQGTKVSYLKNFHGGGSESTAVVTGTGEDAITNNLTGQMGYVTVAEQELDVSGLTIGINLFGGGASAPVNGNIKTVLTDLDMRKTYSGGSIAGTYVYGGCNDAVIRGDVYLTLQGTDSDNLCKFRTVYGGNASNRIYGTTYVEVLDNVTTGRDFLVAGGRFKGPPIATVDATYLKIDGVHSVIGDTFGGGHQGNVLGDTHVEILNGTVEVVYGGGSDDTATVGGNAYITIGSAETAPIIENQVYGSGNEGGVVGNTYVDLYNGTFQKDIYGGGRYGTVGGDTNVVLHNGTLKENAFGGGYYAAAVANRTFITVEQATVAKSVYGGGNEAPVQTTATVTINGGQVNNRVFGGGYAKTAAVSDTKVYLFGGKILLDAFGGGNLAPTGTTEVYEIGTALTESIYGGGFQKGSDVYSPNVTVIGGTMSSVYGGGYDGAIIDNPQTKAMEGNTNVRIEGDPEEVLTIGETDYIPSDVLLKYLFGGGYRGTVEGNTNVVVHDASGRTYDWENRNVVVGVSSGVSRAIYGGSNLGKVNGTANLLFEDWCFGVSSAGGSVYMFGGGSAAGATVGATNFVIRNCYYRPNGGRGFGGGYKAEVLGDSSFVLEGITNYNGTFFGGGENAAVHGTATSKVLDNSHIEECLYAGGRYASAPVGNTHVVIDTQDQYLAEFGNKKFTLEHTLYGGGILGDVKGNTLIEFKNGSLNKSAYAGGDIANVGGTSTIKVSGNSKLNTNVYGGGRGDTRVAEVGNTVVLITENAQIKGGVYGGGEGVRSLVHGTTDVTIDQPRSFSVAENENDPVDPTSGKTDVVITLNGEGGSVGGSVYGGGNRGSVGAGTVIVGTNNAKLTEVGKTKVTVKNGYIAGSVFGGGRGEPTQAEPYQTSMGAVFGSTETNIYGGYIAGKNGVGGVYGGGEKSRVYAEVGQKAVTVNVDATVADTDIAIYGSVFGGGDRGEGDTMNTSIPTTVGDVEVNIIGETTAENRTTPTQIYIKQGGVFGDGNLCNTEGNRVVNIQNFGTGEEPRADGSTLKTLHSIQRADTVNLINSDVVLIGLEDALDSSDYEKYSISRVGALYMKEGSTVKLDSLVKFLGALHSDYQPERTFIDKGYNDVNNNYTGHGGQLENVEKLSNAEIAEYINNDVTLKNNHTAYNTVCIANGRYLTVADENGVYGPVTGLYTLELLNAVPGEGGGFVYGDITGSTGDFICTTPYSAMARSADGYMDVIDNVGKLVGEPDYSYYYWYISGNEVQYDLNIDGYIGINKQDYSDRVAFAYPTSDQTLHYVLESVAVNDTLAALLTGANAYDLLTSADAVANTANKAIAVEFKLSGESIGFLTKSGEKWALLDGTVKTGLEGVQVEDAGAASQISTNTLLTKKIDGTNNVLEVILYRSDAVTEWTEGMEVNLTLKAFQTTNGEVYQPIENGAHTHVINATMALRRMVPKQAIFAENRRNYVGVAGLTALHINEHSSFSVEVQTNYIPSAFPKINDSTFVTSLNISSLPIGTKITMADLTGTVPTFYYYIKKGNEATVDLMNFMQMGTEKPISQLAEKPAFVQAYEAQESEVVNERLLFVCDFEQVAESVWSGYNAETPYNGTLQVNHLYNSKEIMEYTDENDIASTAKELTFAIHPTVEGLDAFSMTFDTQSADGEDDAESESGVFPAKGTSQFDVVLTESIVAIDTRYYEGKFALKLQMYLDDSATPVDLPDGITFECDGVTYYPDGSNEFAVVGVDGFGTHTVNMNTDLFGITGVTGKVTLKATVYSAPEPVYFNSILTPRVGEASFTLGVAEEHHLLVHCENSPTNLLLDKSEALQFTLTTKQTGDDEAVVSVDAYRKVDGAYTESVDLGALFTEEHQALAQTDGAAVPYSWILSDTAPEGTYRLVYTFADRVEYLYFIVN